MLQARVPLVLDLPDRAWFDVQLMHKDIRLALRAASESRVPLPAASAADRALSWAEELGYGHRDIAGLFQVLSRMAAPEAADRPGKPAPDQPGGPANVAADGPGNPATDAPAAAPEAA
jgi:hypothetical protein